MVEEVRLDRAICNDAWLDFWRMTSCCTLTRSKSNHHPPLLTFTKEVTPHYSSFKFQKMWIAHPDCRRLVSETWNKPVFGCSMDILSQKLKALKLELKTWNKEIFGDVHYNVEKAVDAINQVQVQLSDEGWSESLADREREAQLNLQQALLYEDEFWREKSRINWHASGDRNTTFFHKVTKIRMASKQMTILRKGNIILDKAADIEQHVVEYFPNLFASENVCIENDLISQNIPCLVSEEDNSILTKVPTLEEVHLAIFSLNGQGAPGPDGFGGCFFQSRPVALANFKFKIITKVLADRLAQIAPKVISENQRGFIKDRHITDCICITSEVINQLDKRSFGGNIAMKIDIKKAFDTMDWTFLLQVLKSFGFHSTLCNWICVILHSAKLSFSVNGHAVGHFSCKRGVRQGDPLSPLLFCLAEDVLSRGISNLMDNNRLLPMSGPRGCHTPSHVLYTDDIMIFCRGTKQNMINLKSLFQAYGDASGQHISVEKCKFYSGNITSHRVAIISSVLGFSAGQVPFTYLGVPIFIGKPRKGHLQPIVDKIKCKLASWKGSLLSIMGRVQLVKSIIQGMLVYSFHSYAWPVSLLKAVDQWIRNFIWSGDTSSKKLLTVAWKTVCSPFDERGWAYGLCESSMKLLCLNYVGIL